MMEGSMNTRYAPEMPSGSGKPDKRVGRERMQAQALMPRLLNLWLDLCFNNRIIRAKSRCAAFIRDARGQGTTEYAILVGVIVVIAIIAISLFRPKLEELWNAVADGINNL